MPVPPAPAKFPPVPPPEPPEAPEIDGPLPPPFPPPVEVIVEKIESLPLAADPAGVAVPPAPTVTVYEVPAVTDSPVPVRNPPAPAPPPVQYPPPPPPTTK